MNRTSSTERIHVGQVPVEVRWHLRGDHTIHKTVLWCEHAEEAVQFLKWCHISHLQLTGFKASYFTITPEMRIITAEDMKWMSVI